jgi:hypothetical protein
MTDPYEDWMASDQYHAKIRLAYIRHAGKISDQEEQRLKDLMRSPDRENYSVAELIIMIKDEDKSEEPLSGQRDSEIHSDSSERTACDS